MEGLQDVQDKEVSTPFGPPSDIIKLGTLEGTGIAFLPRHGRGHRISPTEVPSRANIYALKSLGVEWIISVGAVGSLKEEIRPLDMVIPNQIIDRTKSRDSTFFGKGIVAHVAFADPFCPVLSALLFEEAQKIAPRVHRGGTYIVMEGPLFSTKAESELYRSWGASVIGMTALPEAKLAREAELCYATLACATDYDCWHESHESVSVEMLLYNLSKNAENAKKIIRKVIARIPPKRECGCASALNNAIITDPLMIPPARKKELGLLVNKYIK
ncbi:MAG: S-methyl-5'-thioadenosine phosphorylase [Candidatus Tectomicrobia bacterium]|uniref:S-methyl-5'-thioadenosine phosphorylase n=1 Tax=Tectimicrobiota bacterium TaxID=2528274 RepID=A0A933LQ79_UNCTE|nr:S-methyl-5'-thioadenosine phosphorylase [Candidatus Tectomicrobia bacterium]